MAEPLDPGTEDDALLERVRAGVSGIRARPDALAVVQHHVTRRRRRRRVVGAVASVATAAVVVPLALVALRLQGDDEVAPADPAPTQVLDGTRPAAFFVSEAGGRSRAQLVRYRAVAQERYHARFLWWPEVDADSPVFAGAAVEEYDGSPDAACAGLVGDDEDAGGSSSCVTTADGRVARVADTTAGAIAIDAIHRRGRLTNAADDDVVRTVTVFRDDGWAVSLTLCACVAWKGTDLDEPPLSGAELADVASAEAWVPNPDGPPS